MQSSAESCWQKIRGRSIFLGALLLLGVLAAIYSPGPRVLADSDAALKDAARRLAERVAAIPGLRGPLRLEWHADESWSEGEGARWQDALRDAFDRRALQWNEDAATPALAIYAAQTSTQVVLTAKTRVADREEIRVVAVARAALPPAELPVAPVRLERQLIYESPDQILDASNLMNFREDGLAVLIYRNFEPVILRVNQSGELKQTLPLRVAGLKPTRDPRGEIFSSGNQATAQLWGKTCDMSWDSAAEPKCRSEKTSASADSVSAPEVSLTSPCDDANWTISGVGNERGVRGMLRLIPDGATAGSSATLTSDFPGPVLNVSGDDNQSHALVIIRNLRTGNYEVYQITLVCGN